MVSIPETPEGISNLAHTRDGAKGSAIAFASARGRAHQLGRASTMLNLTGGGSDRLARSRGRRRSAERSAAALPHSYSVTLRREHPADRSSPPLDQPGFPLHERHPEPP